MGKVYEWCDYLCDTHIPTLFRDLFGWVRRGFKGKPSVYNHPSQPQQQQLHYPYPSLPQLHYVEKPPYKVGVVGNNRTVESVEEFPTIEEARMHFPIVMATLSAKGGYWGRDAQHIHIRDVVKLKVCPTTKQVEVVW